MKANAEIQIRRRNRTWSRGWYERALPGGWHEVRLEYEARCIRVRESAIRLVPLMKPSKDAGNVLADLLEMKWADVA